MTANLWFSHEDFHDRVVEIWNKPVTGQNSVQRWNKKMSLLRRHLRGWASHTIGLYKQHKAFLLSMINDLDVAGEVRILSQAERDQLTGARDQLTRLLRDEEIKYYQHAKATNSMLGDNNTRYFQMIVNGKHRKKRIFSLDDNEKGEIEGQANLKAYTTHFYKDLFGPTEENSFTLDESLRDDIPQVTTSENEFLIAPFTELEIRNAVFDMEHNKAPGPDGFPAEFYQNFWEIIKGDLMQMFLDLHAGVLPLFSLNFDVITLLPKVQEANMIQQYRPICLLNVSFKIFTKVATIRVNAMADRIVSPTQIAFMRGRNILERVVILHETIHELHKKNKVELYSKLILRKLAIRLDGHS
jgi:hypothetical protein